MNTTLEKKQAQTPSHDFGEQKISQNNKVSFTQMLGLSAQNTFVKHLFDIDHSQERKEGHSYRRAGVSWIHALQALNLNTLLQGIRLTPNFLFFVLFVGLIAWLFVIYWVRHNEPLANSVIGTHYGPGPTAQADRSMLTAGTKHALPFHTSVHTGEMYVPSPEATTETPAPAQNFRFGQSSNNTINSHPFNPSAAGAYFVPISQNNGTRLKMIVNR